MSNNYNQKHLSLEQRIFIQQSITNGDSKLKIAKALDKDPSTIGKEIKKHRSLVHASSMVSNCTNYKKCTHNHVCTDCPDFSPFYCARRDRSPGACNGCSNYNHCRADKYRYSADIANKEYESELKESRQGINMTKEELQKVADIIVPLVKNGLSPYAIKNGNDNLDICIKTIYNYIESGYLHDFGLTDLDLRNKVSRKMKKKDARKYKKREDRKYLKNRTYTDFKNYIEENGSRHIVQMDTVYNSPSGAIMQTFKFLAYGFMFIVYHESRTAKAMVEGIDLLEEILGPELFRKEVELILTDRGSEFTNVEEIERKDENGNPRTRVFYCDPMASGQKGSLENNHREIRYICPKNKDLVTLGLNSQSKANLMTSHINSVSKKQLEDKSPFELMEFLSPKLYQRFTEHGISPVEKAKIILTPSLIKEEK